MALETFRNVPELVWLSGRLGQSCARDGYYFESLVGQARSCGYITLSLHYPQFRELVIPPAFNQRVRLYASAAGLGCFYSGVGRTETRARRSAAVGRDVRVVRSQPGQQQQRLRRQRQQPEKEAGWTHTGWAALLSVRACHGFTASHPWTSPVCRLCSARFHSTPFQSRVSITAHTGGAFSSKHWQLIGADWQWEVCNTQGLS